jgi:hypothetical protein
MIKQPPHGFNPNRAALGVIVDNFRAVILAVSRLMPVKLNSPELPVL